MRSYRESPDGEENQAATRQHNRDVFAAKMSANLSETPNSSGAKLSKDLQEMLDKTPILSEADYAELGKAVRKAFKENEAEVVLCVEIENLRTRAETAEKERDEVREARASTQQWYAARWERLKEWARSEIPSELSNQFFNILANGTKDVNEPPTYARQLAILQIERDEANKRVTELEKRISSIQQINASTDGGPVIMEGRRGMISDIARQALETKGE